LVGTHHLAQVLWVEPAGEGGGIDQIAEHHRQLPPFGVCRARYAWCRSDLRRLGCLSGLRLFGVNKDGSRGGGCTAGPAQYSAVLTDREALRLNDFGFQVREVGLVETELPLQRPVGHPSAATQHLDGLIQHLLECHGRSSVCCAPPTTAVWR